jgi:hypothetical protein
MGTYGEWKGHDLLLQEDRRPLFAEAGLPRAREIRPKGTRSIRISDFRCGALVSSAVSVRHFQR